MHKISVHLVTIFAAGFLFGGISFARQTPAPSTQQPAASAPSTSAPKKPSAAKTGPSSTAKKPATPPVVLQTPKDKASYAIGMSIGTSIAQQTKKDRADIDPALVARGLKDALSGDKTLMTDAEAKAAVAAFQQELVQAVSLRNRKEGDDFLATNKTKPDVVTTPSGLEYKVLKAGDGPKPTATDTVICNYRGTLLDGTEFDSSVKHGKPITLTVGQVIKGWTEALQLMPVGSKWELYIPPSLAYGDRGTPNGPIGPNSTLIFEVELLSIQPKPQPKLLTPGEPGTQPESPQPQTPPPSPQPQSPQPQSPQPKP